MEKVQAILKADKSDGLFSYKAGELCQILVNETREKGILLGVENIALTKDEFKIIEQQVHIEWMEPSDKGMRKKTFIGDLSKAVELLKDKPNGMNFRNFTANIRVNEENYELD